MPSFGWRRAGRPRSAASRCWRTRGRSWRPPAGVETPFPTDVLALGIDAADPPGATLRQIAGYTAILGALPGEGGAPFSDAGRDLRVAFLNLSRGQVEIIPLSHDNPPPADPEPPLDAVLHSFDGLTCTDEMAVALVDWPGSAEALDYGLHLLTCWRKIEYSLVDFQQGTLPLSTEELGGWLRSLIATRPALDLRALYWEHTQANLDPSLSLRRGLTNSAAMTAVVNRNIAGKSGMAIRDRSTRQLGAFHQKCTVLVKRVQTTPDEQDAATGWWPMSAASTLRMAAGTPTSIPTSTPSGRTGRAGATCR